MSNYGLNFGFRRSGGDSAVREGRFRVPKTGTFRQGEIVTIDPAAPGFVKKAAAGAAIVPGVTGLLIQHDAWQESIYEAGEVDSHGKGGVRGGNLCTIWAGQGEKIWLKNTAEQPNRWDGRSIPARTVITATGLVIGDDLEWDGDKFVKASSGTPVATVTATNGTDYAEAVLLS